MMRVVFALPFVLANVLAATAAPQLSPVVIPTDYVKLNQLCIEGGDRTYVGVRYGSGYYTTFKYGDCYPYQIGPLIAEQAVFCRSATCISNPGPNCSGGADLPAPVTVPPGLTLANEVDFVKLIGQGATCEDNGLSSIPV